MKTSTSKHIDWAHPLVQEWFIQQYNQPTEPQCAGWPSILAGKPSLISAPTGSGKTFAAFLVCIDELVRASLAHQLTHQTSVLYISPLKALSNDIQKNLLTPLKQIQQLAEDKGLFFQEIEVAVRTGDTLARERQSMLKKPPHILVTTPESFFLLLTAEKSRVILKAIRTVIIDEIHALVNSKRGSHLSLSLERLDALADRPPLRIGLSATQRPLELVAHFLTGVGKEQANIINIGHQRAMELGVRIPTSLLESVTSNEVWKEIYDQIADLAHHHRSILVFVNTRKLAERIAHHLGERLGAEQVTAHHGSLSRKLRLAAEHGLKTGTLKIIVATASLELGIDIGTVDLICQIGSPRSIGVALQRIGRAGHWYGAISKGFFYATTRDELIECAALMQAIQNGDLDHLIIPEQPLDILAQQIVAICASEDYSEQALFALIKKSYPYRNLSAEIYKEIIEMLSNGISASRGRYGSYLLHDQVNGILKGRRGSRMAAILNGSAIPETNLFTVIALPEETIVGSLDEEFAIESHRGDIILLGNTSWRIHHVEHTKGRVIVEDAHGASPSVPFWLGEAPGRTDELSHYVSELRIKLEDLLFTQRVAEKEIINWLTQSCLLTDYGAHQMIQYLKEAYLVLGAIPSQKTIIAERFFDESGGMQLIIHAPFGARINKAWGLALRKRFCRSFNFELQAAATDNGIAISLAEQHSFPLKDVFQFLHANSVEKVLVQAVLQSPLFLTRWRWDAIRSLALLRYRNGRKLAPNILRLLADDLLAAVFPDAAACQDNLGGKEIKLPHHFLIIETMKDCLTEALDIEGLKHVTINIASGKTHCIAIDTPTPSAFCHEILNANPYAFLDDAPLEERRTRAVTMRRILPNSLQDKIGHLDQEVIHQVKEQAWPDIRNADELHDLLQTIVSLPSDCHLVDSGWKLFFDQLITENRVGKAVYQNKAFWLATEKKELFKLIYPDAVLQQQLPSLSQNNVSIDAVQAIEILLRGWLQHIGPTTSKELSALLAIPSNEIEQGLIRLESTGFILRGHFRSLFTHDIEWCERSLLARIHHMTMAKLRREIEPVSAQQYLRWLADWQHLTPETQLRGEQGVLEVIKQLQGFEIPANAWEKQVFARRINQYSPEMLDRLCLSGVVIWGRSSLHPTIELALRDDANEDKPAFKAIHPQSTTAITFFVREETGRLIGQSVDSRKLNVLSYNAQLIYDYLQNQGASFFSDLVEDLQKLKAEIEQGLWELVAAGLITADSFDNLRALIDPHRRAGKRRFRRTLSFSQGRWSVLKSAKPIEAAKKTELTCQILLNRYGICFRELIQREKMAHSWGELLPTFRRLEAQGEIRGGRFIRGFYGEQFALPYALESLRQNQKKSAAEVPLSIFAADPLNLIGILTAGEKISSRSGKQIILPL